jgi:methylmalonyl-CoA mutase N-terminal domain/subunit
VPVEPLYTPADLEPGWDPLERLGFPGEYPFTRGPYTSMYRTRLWTMRQFAGFGTAAETNRRYHYLLEHGQTGLSVAFDFPTLMGYDSDHPRSSVRWAVAVWPLPAWRTWKRCSTASHRPVSVS